MGPFYRVYMVIRLVTRGVLAFEDTSSECLCQPIRSVPCYQAFWINWLYGCTIEAFRSDCIAIAGERLIGVVH